MSNDDANYFNRRADAELRLAQQATHRSAVRAHLELADAYRNRLAATPWKWSADA